MRKAGLAIGLVAAAGVVIAWCASPEPEAIAPAPAIIAEAEPAAPDAAVAVAAAPSAQPAASGTPSLIGFVTLAGQPAAATVHVGLEVVKAGADGRFEWSGSASAPISVWAEHGTARSVRTLIAIDPEQAAQVSIELFDAVPVFGRVLGGLERRPIKGIKVRFETLTGEVLVTDAEGNFSSDAVLPGLNEVAIEAWKPWASQTQTLPIVPGRPNEFELIIDLEHVIEGHVRDASGAPVAGANVHLTRPGEAAEILASQPDGTFRFQRVARAPHSLKATQGTDQSRVLTTGPTTDITLTLRAGASLTVTIVRDERSPAGLECSVKAEPGLPSVDEQAEIADDAGIARFEGLQPRAVVVWARVPGGRWHWLGQAFVKPGANTFTGTYADDGLTVKVEVLGGPERRGLANATVTIDGVTQRTDAAGATVFTDVKRHTSETWPDIVATANGYAKGRGYLRPKQASIVLVLQPWRQLNGQAFGSNGKPIGRLQIDGQPVATGPDGRFELRIPGATNAHKSQFSCPWCLPATVVIAPGISSADVGRVVLQVGGTIEVTVTTPDGRPASFATVLLRTQPGQPRWLTRRERASPGFPVDDQGKATIPVDP
ncbi:MAG: hypothetical protein H6Q89_2589, partial [Myxococcaceae bacterium]|nr:hypothetical protein [Myxococcaceae bacterium]